MTITTTIENNKATFALDGRLDITTAPELDKTIKDVLGDVDAVELNLEKLSYISSAGLRVIIKVQKAMNKKGGLVISNVQPEVHEVFRITGFVDILTIV